MTKITEYIEIILEGNDLSFDQAKQLLDTIFEGQVAEVQIAAFLAAMRTKKASVTEIAGLASSLREHAVPVKVNAAPLVDTCGTGGAALKTFNISTAGAFVAAGAGVRERAPAPQPLRRHQPTWPIPRELSNQQGAGALSAPRAAT